MSVEHFTIYNTQTGAIRVSGSGPQGIAALQAMNTGEAMTPQPSVPGPNSVDTSSGQPIIISTPGYQPAQP